MKKNLSVLALCALATAALYGCEGANEIAGRLRLDAPVSAVNDSGDQVTMDVDSYSADLVMGEDGSMLRIARGLLRAPVLAYIPKLKMDQTGVFSASSAETKQNFSLQGEISMESGTESGYGSETCIYGYQRERVCREVVDRKPDDRKKGKDNKGGRGRRVICEWKDVPIMGTRSYTYTEDYTDKMARIELIESNGSIIGNYNGSYRVTSEKYDYRYDACLR